MKKKYFINGRNLMTAGMLSILMFTGMNTALAEQETAAPAEVTAGTEAMTEAGTAASSTDADNASPAGAAAGPVTAAEAEEIALADAGVTVDMAERLRTETEREDGETVYEVSFVVDGVDYDYQIREADGSILEWELDGRDLQDASAEESLKSGDAAEGESETEPAQAADTLIGLESAREIALADAGLTSGDVVFSKIKYEKERRRTVYEFEFYQGNTEYEYTIDAYSGDVLEMEID